MAWSALESFGSTGASFVLSVVMARFLPPSAFGLVALMQIFVAVARVFVDSGMTEALVRRPHRAPAADSTAFLLNVAAGVAAYILLWLLAVPVAAFYGDPELVPLMRVICIGVPLNALCVVQTARLTSSMRFDRLFKVTGSAVLISGGVGVAMAAGGFGVWALVWQQVSMWGTRAALLWLVAPGLEGLRFSRDEARSLTSFSWKVMASSMLDTIWSHLNLLVIGKVFTSSQTGLYWRAQSFAVLPASVATGVVTRVAMPMFSRVGGRPERLRVMFGRVLGLSAWVVFPVMALMCALAAPIFSLLFTPEWAPAVPMFRILCLAGMLYPVHALNLCVLNVEGRSDLFLRLEVIKKLLAVAMLCVTVPAGILAVCRGVLAVSVICLGVNAWYSGGYVKWTLRAQLRFLAPPFFAAWAAGASAWGMTLWMDGFPTLGFAAATLVGVTVYLLLSHILRMPWPARLKALKV